MGARFLDCRHSERSGPAGMRPTPIPGWFGERLDERSGRAGECLPYTPAPADLPAERPRDLPQIGPQAPNLAQRTAIREDAQRVPPTVSTAAPGQRFSVVCCSGLGQVAPDQSAVPPVGCAGARNPFPSAGENRCHRCEGLAIASHPTRQARHQSPRDVKEDRPSGRQNAKPTRFDDSQN